MILRVRRNPTEASSRLMFIIPRWRATVRCDSLRRSSQNVPCRGTPIKNGKCLNCPSRSRGAFCSIRCTGVLPKRKSCGKRKVECNTVMKQSWLLIAIFVLVAPIVAIVGVSELGLQFKEDERKTRSDVAPTVSFFSCTSFRWQFCAS